jgi:predicted nucleic acid-binding protein
VSVEPTLHDERHVLDASALLRLYLADGPLPERLEAVMERGCRGEGVLLVPDLCWLELTSVLSRQISRALLTAEEATDLLAELQRLPLRTMASMELCSTVIQLSQVQRISVYDATYLALALRYGAILLTADQQLAGAAERTGCGG